MDNPEQLEPGKKITRKEALERLHQAKTHEETLAIIQEYGGELPVGPASGWEQFIPLPSFWGQT